MIRLSVKVPNYLYQQLVEKNKKMGGDNISTTVRSLLSLALEHQAGSSNSTLLHCATNSTVMMHCLVEEYLSLLVERVSELRNKAHEKIEKLIAELSEKS